MQIAKHVPNSIWQLAKYANQSVSKRGCFFPAALVQRRTLQQKSGIGILLAMSQRRRMDDGQRWRAVGRLESGQSVGEVAQFFGVHHSVISRLWTQFQSSGTVSRRPGSGRPRVTTPADDRYIRLLVRRHRRATAPGIRASLIAATGRQVAVSTVRRRLHALGFYARRPTVCVPLSARHRAARLQWCREHVTWTVADWSNVLFTDESRYALQNDDRRILVWREAGTRYQAANIVERHAFGGGGVTAWGGISFGGRTVLHIFGNVTVTAQRYRDEILHPHVRLYAAARGPDFVLMDDNARPHRARMVNDYLMSEGIQRMSWPAYSPDLNPIEHVWDALGRAVASHQPPPRAPTCSRTRVAITAVRPHRSFDCWHASSLRSLHSYERGSHPLLTDISQSK